ncbi:GumC family protein [Jannaschia sp. 2305UL9-9]|uniref:GumC family protein n=1 Tax=Jannaschia sp. 2305UL9-9 TaxID=3121638 RepID=UPI003529B433
MTHDVSDQSGPARGLGALRPNAEELFDGIDPNEVIRGIWQGRYIILLFAFLGAALAAIIVSQITPTYASMAKILLDPRERSFVSQDQVVSDLRLNDEVVASEISILYSNVLLGEVAREINASRPDLLEELAPTTSEPSLLSRMAGAIGLGGEEPLSPEEEEQAFTDRLDGLVWILRQAIDVWRDGDAYIISVRAETENPVLSALIAETVVSKYIEQQLEGRRQTANQATAQIEERVAALREQVQAAEAAVEDYRDETIRENGSSIEILAQRLLDLNAELVQARIERGAAEARYSEMQRAMTDGGIDALSTMVTSETINDLTNRRLELQASDAEWAERFDETNPERRRILGRIAEVDRALAVEMARALDAQRNEWQVAVVRERTMQEALADVEARYQEASRSAIGLRQLERETEAVRDVYKELLTRVAQTRTQQSFQVADARVIERATVPGSPSAPRPKLVTMLGLIVGAGLGFAIVLLRRLTSRTFRDLGELERLSGQQVVSVMPEQRWKRTAQALKELGANPMGATAESVRALRNHLNSGAQRSMTRSVSLLSPMSGDGKTTATLLLACLAEKADEMVVVVDLDLRQDTLSKELGLGRRPGASDVMAGEVSLDQAIVSLDDYGIDILTAGEIGVTIADELRVDTIRTLLDDLKETYDLVLVNSPAMLQVPDATLIAKAVDQCVLLVRYDSTPRSAVKRCVGILRAQRAPLEGLVMTRADAEAMQDGYLYSYGYA